MRFHTAEVTGHARSMTQRGIAAPSGPNALRESTFTPQDPVAAEVVTADAPFALRVPGDTRLRGARVAAALGSSPQVHDPPSDEDRGQASKPGARQSGAPTDRLSARQRPGELEGEYVTRHSNKYASLLQDDDSNKRQGIVRFDARRSFQVAARRKQRVEP